MSTLALCIDEDDLARLEGGAAVSLADPLNNLKVYVCARGAGYIEVDCAQIAVGTDVRTGQKCQFITVKMIPQIQSVPAEHVAVAV